MLIVQTVIEPSLLHTASHWRARLGFLLNCAFDVNSAEVLPPFEIKWVAGGYISIPPRAVGKVHTNIYGVPTCGVDDHLMTGVVAGPIAHMADPSRPCAGAIATVHRCTGDSALKHKTTKPSPAACR